MKQSFLKLGSNWMARSTDSPTSTEIWCLAMVWSSWRMENGYGIVNSHFNGNIEIFSRVSCFNSVDSLDSGYYLKETRVVYWRFLKLFTFNIFNLANVSKSSFSCKMMPCFVSFSFCFDLSCNFWKLRELNKCTWRLIVNSKIIKW